ncbi:MAG: AAA family ATPase [Blastocatellia bacterium]|nr:AAA family ATPase [Blastocatellia bacterium]
MREASAWVQPLRDEISRAVVGQQYLVDRLIVGLIANGHLLLEGVPGLAKTLSLRTLAGAIDAQFQQTPSRPGTVRRPARFRRGAVKSDFFAVIPVREKSQSTRRGRLRSLSLRQRYFFSASAFFFSSSRLIFTSWPSTLMRSAKRTRRSRICFTGPSTEIFSPLLSFTAVRPVVGPRSTTNCLFFLVVLSMTILFLMFAPRISTSFMLTISPLTWRIFFSIFAAAVFPFPMAWAVGVAVVRASPTAASIESFVSCVFMLSW